MTIDKVTDPAKIVTDPVMLSALAKQGIDKDYVEFIQDYAPRSLGKEHSPYAKFYRSLKSNKKFMVVSGLPMVKPDGTKIEVGWLYAEGKYYSKPNLFSAIIEGTQVQVTVLSDQPTGVKENDRAVWQPQLFLNNIEQFPISSEPTLLKTDPVNPNYHQNVLEWDYGICKRRIRIIEGRFRERWLFVLNPNSEVKIRHNFQGDYRPKVGIARDAVGNPLAVQVVNNDEEIIPVSEFARKDIVYPVEIGAEATYYPDADPETSSVDGRVQRSASETWAVIRVGAGTDVYPSAALYNGSLISAAPTTNLFDVLTRSIMLFDTSGLPDNAIISAATLSVYGLMKTDALNISPDINVYSSNPASNTDLIAADFTTLGSTAFATAITYANWSLVGYNDFTLNTSGIAAISKINVSKFGLRNANYDVSGDTVPWVVDAEAYTLGYFAEQGTVYKPKLVVTYTVPSRSWGFIIG